MFLYVYLGAKLLKNRCITKQIVPLLPRTGGAEAVPKRCFGGGGAASLSGHGVAIAGSERCCCHAGAVLAQVVHDRGSLCPRSLFDLPTTVIRPAHGREPPRKRRFRSTRKMFSGCYNCSYCSKSGIMVGPFRRSFFSSFSMDFCTNGPTGSSRTNFLPRRTEGVTIGSVCHFRRKVS